MTAIAMGSSAQLGMEIMNLMHGFRAEVFVKRLGWSLPTENGLEKDEYDTPDAKYVVMTDGLGRVTGSARLLQTTSDYMLPNLFPQLLAGLPAPRSSDVWELSRFATSVRTSGEGRVLSLSDQTLELLEVVFDLAREHRIARLILVTSIGIERLMLRAGLDAHRIAPPAPVDGNLCVALFIDVPAGKRRAEAPGLAATFGTRESGNVFTGGARAAASPGERSFARVSAHVRKGTASGQ